jgi:predicted ATP-dependent serine protease
VTAQRATAEDGSSSRHLQRGTGNRRAVIVRGEPGIGKSRLTADFQDYLRARGWSVHKARCQAHLKKTPFAPWTRAS